MHRCASLCAYMHCVCVGVEACVNVCVFTFVCTCECGGECDVCIVEVEVEG